MKLATLSYTRKKSITHLSHSRNTYTFGLRLSTHATMSTALGNEDLVPEQTEGFKVGEKKTIDEYQKLGESSIC